MEVVEAVRGRRSIRKFVYKSLSKDQLTKLLEAARLAPSGANRQSWRIVYIADRERIKQLVPICKNQTFLEECSLFLVGVDDPQQKWARVDLSIALDHVTLVAYEMELGTCWIGAFDPERMAEFVSLPRGLVVTVCLAIGYPDEEPEARSRRPLNELFFPDRYGSSPPS